MPVGRWLVESFHPLLVIPVAHLIHSPEKNTADIPRSMADPVPASKPPKTLWHPIDQPAYHATTKPARIDHSFHPIGETGLYGSGKGSLPHKGIRPSLSVSDSPDILLALPCCMSCISVSLSISRCFRELVRDLACNG